MTRRYLTRAEIELALSRGKNVEVFLGGFTQQGKDCIRWATFNKTDDTTIGEIWEVLDEGSQGYLDLSTFNPVNKDFYDTPVKTEKGLSIL